MDNVKTGQFIASVRKSRKISVRVLRKEKRLRKSLLAVCAAGLIVLALMLYIWGPAIFQKRNPLPYLMAAMKISDEQPYVQVDSRPGVYISRRGSCPELFADIEAGRKLNFIEQAGSAYLFSNGVCDLIVSSEIYWGKYTVWTVPQVTLR